MKRLILLLTGILCCGISLSIVIIYINLLLYGFSFLYFIKMLLKTWDFYLLFLGLYLIKKNRF